MEKQGSEVLVRLPRGAVLRAEADYVRLLDLANSSNADTAWAAQKALAYLDRIDRLQESEPC